MKIPLKIIDKRPYLITTIRSQHLRIGLGQILFVVDTGSNQTFIGGKDCERFNISVKDLPTKTPLRMGGFVYIIKEIKYPIKFYFRDEENKLKDIEFKTFQVAVPTLNTDKGKNESSSFPSIIGTDFLYDNKFSLHFLPSKEEAYLEKEDITNS